MHTLYENQEAIFRTEHGETVTRQNRHSQNRDRQNRDRQNRDAIIHFKDCESKRENEGLIDQHVVQ
jgi:hypothetical protein